MRTANWTRAWTGLALLAAPALALAEDGHGGRPDLFNADIGNFVFTLIIFGLVVLILGKFAWKPLLNVLNEREKTIRDSLETARAEREQAQRLLADYKAQLEKARQEATAITDEGRRDAEAVRQRILEDARKETADMTERARREIQLATDTAIRDLYDRTAELSVDVARRVLQRELTPADHQRLISESLTEIKNSGAAKLN